MKLFLCEGSGGHQYNPVTLEGHCIECGGLDPNGKSAVKVDSLEYVRRTLELMKKTGAPEGAIRHVENRIREMGGR